MWGLWSEIALGSCWLGNCTSAVVGATRALAGRWPRFGWSGSKGSYWSGSGRAGTPMLGLFGNRLSCVSSKSFLEIYQSNQGSALLENILWWKLYQTWYWWSVLWCFCQRPSILPCLAQNLSAYNSRSNKASWMLWINGASVISAKPRPASAFASANFRNRPKSWRLSYWNHWKKKFVLFEFPGFQLRPLSDSVYSWSPSYYRQPGNFHLSISHEHHPSLPQKSKGHLCSGKVVRWSRLFCWETRLRY